MILHRSKNRYTIFCTSLTLSTFAELVTLIALVAMEWVVMESLLEIMRSHAILHQQPDRRRSQHNPNLTSVRGHRVHNYELSKIYWFRLQNMLHICFFLQSTTSYGDTKCRFSLSKYKRHHSSWQKPLLHFRMLFSIRICTVLHTSTIFGCTHFIKHVQN